MMGKIFDKNRKKKNGREKSEYRNKEERKKILT